MPKTPKPLNNLPKRAALYARVSTLDKGQDPETQLMQLRDIAPKEGLIL